MPLVYEARTTAAEPWMEVGVLSAADPPGSISHTGPDGQREVIVFRCDGVTSAILIPRGGVCTDFGPIRKIDAIGLDTIATLADGEEFEMPVVSDVGISYLARWRHRA